MEQNPVFLRLSANKNVYIILLQFLVCSGNLSLCFVAMENQIMIPPPRQFQRAAALTPLLPLCGAALLIPQQNNCPNGKIAAPPHMTPILLMWKHTPKMYHNCVLFFFAAQYILYFCFYISLFCISMLLYFLFLYFSVFVFPGCVISILQYACIWCASQKVDKPQHNSLNASVNESVRFAV